MQKMITRICEQCRSEFQVRLTETKRKPRKGNVSGYGRFCSDSCRKQNETKKIQLICAACGKQFERSQCHASNSRKKSSNSFCCKSCAATYNNTHKTTGTRRSKLESYLEQQLRSEFPNLELICNGKDAIGSELDFYFPQLRLAIELNGIFHYEPIYGVDKLEQVQRNDQQKSIACHLAGIEFCTIDTSSAINTTQAVKERYWSIVKNLVAPLMGRAGNTSVQVS